MNIEEQIYKLEPRRLPGMQRVVYRQREQETVEPISTCFEFDIEAYPISSGSYGLFWPTYDRAPGTGPDAETGHFRHWCRRGLALDYDRDAVVVDNEQAYYGDRFSDLADPSTWFDPSREISWWFLPSAAALNELLDLAEDGSDLHSDGSFNPPATGKIRIYLYLEMHLDYYRPVTHPEDRVRLGVETDSIPCVLKICYSIIS